MLEAPGQRQSLWMWSELSWRGPPALSDLVRYFSTHRCGRFWPAAIVGSASLWAVMCLRVSSFHWNYVEQTGLVCLVLVEFHPRSIGTLWRSSGIAGVQNRAL